MTVDICGNAEESCPSYGKGICNSDYSCGNQIRLPDNQQGRIDRAKFRYLAKILENQKDIMNDITRLQWGCYK